MLRLLTYLISKGIRTNEIIPDLLSEEADGMPAIAGKACDDGCKQCVDVCPTFAISIDTTTQSLSLDRGSCIACQECVGVCPTGTIFNDRSTEIWTNERADLVLHQGSDEKRKSETVASIFNQSLAIRVVSTGCSACDLELGASSNPIFDMERFGISVVASPRSADALLVTGPVPKSMHDAVLSCYRAMAEPKLVIACGTCAISGGLHKSGYSQANGLTDLLPVDVFIPGCAPHPWQIIRGILAARRLANTKRRSVVSVHR